MFSVFSVQGKQIKVMNQTKKRTKPEIKVQVDDQKKK